VLQGLLEGFSAFAWTGTAFGLIAMPLLLPLTVPISLIGPLAAWFRGRSLREQVLTAAHR